MADVLLKNLEEEKIKTSFGMAYYAYDIVVFSNKMV